MWVCKSSAMAGIAGKYISIAKGVVAIIAASRTMSQGDRVLFSIKLPRNDKITHCFAGPLATLQKSDSLKLLRNHRGDRSEEHTSELQSRPHLVCRLLLEKK